MPIILNLKHSTKFISMSGMYYIIISSFIMLLIYSTTYMYNLNLYNNIAYFIILQSYYLLCMDLIKYVLLYNLLSFYVITAHVYDF